MKEKKDCKIVQDLLPNYLEHLTSEETNTYINEHMSTCEECRNMLSNMQKEIKVSKEKRDGRSVNFFKKYNRKLKTLGIILGLIIAIFIIVVARRFVIISSLQAKEAKSFDENNYHLKAYMYTGDQLNISEIYHKGDKTKSEILHLGKEEQRKSTICVNPNGNNMYIENELGKFVFENTGDVVVQGHLQEMSLFEKIISAIAFPVKSVECNGKETYWIEPIQRICRQRNWISCKDNKC